MSFHRNNSSTSMKVTYSFKSKLQISSIICVAVTCFVLTNTKFYAVLITGKSVTEYSLLYKTGNYVRMKEIMKKNRRSRTKRIVSVQGKLVKNQSWSIVRKSYKNKTITFSSLEGLCYKGLQSDIFSLKTETETHSFLISSII